MFHSHDTTAEDELPRPCPHMRELLSRLSDDTLGGIARWFAENHIKGCPRCADALVSLRVLHDRLRALGLPALPVTADATDMEGTTASATAATLPPARRSALEAALADLDAGLDAVG